MKRGCRTLTAAYIGGYRIPRRRLQNKQIVWDKDSPKLPRIVFVFLWSRCLSSIIDHAIEMRDRECIIPCVIPFIPEGLTSAPGFRMRQHNHGGCPLSNKATPQKCFQLRNLQGRLNSWNTWSGTVSEWSKCMKGSSASSGHWED